MWAKIKNLLWLNLKKFKLNFIWRLLFIGINFMLLFSSTLTVLDGTYLPFNVFLYILAVISIANILFLFAKINAERDVISLLRSMGASRVFIVFDYVIENTLQFVLSLLIFLICSIFIRFEPMQFLLALTEIFLIGVFTLIFSLQNIRLTEKLMRMN